MIVVCPIRYGAKRSASRKNIGCCKHRHQCNESSIRSSINPNAFWIDSIFIDQYFCSINMVGKILATHMSVNSSTPIPAVAGTGSVVDVQDRVTFVRQEIVEHILFVVIAPPFVRILQVARTMNKNYSRTVGLLRFINSSEYLGVVPCF